MLFQAGAVVRKPGDDEQKKKAATDAAKKAAEGAARATNSTRRPTPKLPHPKIPTVDVEDTHGQVEKKTGKQPDGVAVNTEVNMDEKQYVGSPISGGTDGFSGKFTSDTDITIYGGAKDPSLLMSPQTEFNFTPGKGVANEKKTEPLKKLVNYTAYSAALQKALESRRESERWMNEQFSNTLDKGLVGGVKNLNKKNLPQIEYNSDENSYGKYNYNTTQANTLFNITQKELLENGYSIANKKEYIDAVNLLADNIKRVGNKSWYPISAGAAGLYVSAKKKIGGATYDTYLLVKPFEQENGKIAFAFYDQYSPTGKAKYSLRKSDLENIDTQKIGNKIKKAYSIGEIQLDAQAIGKLKNQKVGASMLVFGKNKDGTRAAFSLKRSKSGILVYKAISADKQVAKMKSREKTTAGKDYEALKEPKQALKNEITGIYAKRENESYFGENARMNNLLQLVDDGKFLEGMQLIRLNNELERAIDKKDFGKAQTIALNLAADMKAINKKYGSYGANPIFAAVGLGNIKPEEISKAISSAENSQQLSDNFSNLRNTSREKADIQKLDKVYIRENGEVNTQSVLDDQKRMRESWDDFKDAIADGDPKRMIYHLTGRNMPQDWSEGVTPVMGYLFQATMLSRKATPKNFYFSTGLNAQYITNNVFEGLTKTLEAYDKNPTKANAAAVNKEINGLMEDRDISFLLGKELNMLRGEIGISVDADPKIVEKVNTKGLAMEDQWATYYAANELNRGIKDVKNVLDGKADVKTLERYLPLGKKIPKEEEEIKKLCRSMLKGFDKLSTLMRGLDENSTDSQKKEVVEKVYDFISPMILRTPEILYNEDRFGFRGGMEEATANNLLDKVYYTIKKMVEKKAQYISENLPVFHVVDTKQEGYEQDLEGIKGGRMRVSSVTELAITLSSAYGNGNLPRGIFEENKNGRYLVVEEKKAVHPDFKSKKDLAKEFQDRIKDGGITSDRTKFNIRVSLIKDQYDASMEQFSGYYKEYEQRVEVGMAATPDLKDKVKIGQFVDNNWKYAADMAAFVATIYPPTTAVGLTYFGIDSGINLYKLTEDMVENGVTGEKIFSAAVNLAVGYLSARGISAKAVGINLGAAEMSSKTGQKMLSLLDKGAENLLLGSLGYEVTRLGHLKKGEIVKVLAIVTFVVIEKGRYAAEHGGLKPSKFTENLVKEMENFSNNPKTYSKVYKNYVRLEKAYGGKNPSEIAEAKLGVDASIKEIVEPKGGERNVKADNENMIFDIKPVEVKTKVESKGGERNVKAEEKVDLEEKPHPGSSNEETQQSVQSNHTPYLVMMSSLSTFAKEAKKSGDTKLKGKIDKTIAKIKNRKKTSDVAVAFNKFYNSISNDQAKGLSPKLKNELRTVIDAEGKFVEEQNHINEKKEIGSDFKAIIGTPETREKFNVNFASTQQDVASVLDNLENNRDRLLAALEPETK